MKYKLGVRQRSHDKAKKVLVITVGIFVGFLVLDCWFNYGRYTIDLIWCLTDKLQ